MCCLGGCAREKLCCMSNNHNYPTLMRKGKVIGVYVCCHCCRQHDNGPIWTFRHFSDVFGVVSDMLQLVPVATLEKIHLYDLLTITLTLLMSLTCVVYNLAPVSSFPCLFIILVNTFSLNVL